MTQVRACLISVYSVGLMGMEGKKGLARAAGGGGQGEGLTFPGRTPYRPVGLKPEYKSHLRSPGLIRITAAEDLSVSILKPQKIPTCSQGLDPLLKSYAIQYGSHEPCVVIEHLKHGKYKLRCAGSGKCTPDFQELA